jgi:hypothetical protein
MSTRDTAEIRELIAAERDEIRELTEHEVDAVGGGLVVIAVIAVLIGMSRGWQKVSCPI